MGNAWSRTFIDLVTVDMAQPNKLGWALQKSNSAVPAKKMSSFWRASSFPEFTAAAPMRRTTLKKTRVAIPGDAFGLHRPTGYGW